MMIYFIYGDDHFRVREQVEGIKAAAVKAGVAVVALEANELTPESLREHVTAGSLFARKAAVFVKNLFAHGAIDLKEKTIDLLPTLPADVTLVIWEEGVPDRRSRLFTALSKIAKRLEKALLQGLALERWVAERAVKKEVRLARSGVTTLAELVGGDLARLDQELEKLALTSGGRALESQDILELVEPTIPTSVFALLDACGGKRRDATLIVERLLSAGDEPLYLLAMLTTHLRRLLLVRDLLSRELNTTPGVLAQELHLHPFVAQKILLQAQSFTMPELVALHRKITDLDLAIKTGGLEAADALILLTTSFSAVRPASLPG